MNRRMKCHNSRNINENMSEGRVEVVSESEDGIRHNRVAFLPFPRRRNGNRLIKRGENWAGFAYDSHRNDETFFCCDQGRGVP